MHVWFELAHPAGPEHTLPNSHHVAAGLDRDLLAKAGCWWLARSAMRRSRIWRCRVLDVSGSWTAIMWMRPAIR